MQQVLGVLDTLKAAYPSSIHAGLTSTPDGRWLFQAEGGTLVFLDASLGQPGYQVVTGVKKVPVSSQGVVPARLCLDPDAQAVPGTGANDILYVAGGRDGLWAIGADTDPMGANPAVRLDDSGNTNPQSQQSRRWCVDVQTVRLGFADYLLALFQRGGLNRLRIYPLDEVRNTYNNATAETGDELEAAYQVDLNSHPTVLAHGEPAEPLFGKGIALAMDVDVLGTYDADVYVAMGHHGLVRVRLHADTMQIGVLDSPTVEWGPVFGDGTTYAMGSSLYDHYRFYEKGVLQRTERPVFADVAVQNDAYGHHLYCAVDHLGWLRFDLSGTWDDQTAIDHQEGAQIPEQTADEQIQLKGNGPLKDRVGYAVGIELEEVPSVEGPVLAVTLSYVPFLYFPLQFTEGASVGSNLEWGRVQEPLRGTVRTYFYEPAEDATWSAPGYNFSRAVPFGGRNLHLPSAQVIDPSPENWQPDDGRVVVYHTYKLVELGTSFASSGACRAVVDIDAGPAFDLFYLRTVDDYLGRFGQSIGFSVVDPDLLVTGGNDAGVSEDGYLVTGDPGSGYEIRATHADEYEWGQTGIVTNQENQYPVPGTQYEQYVLCDGPKVPSIPVGENNPKRYRVMRWDVTSDPFAVNDDHDFRVWEKFLNTPEDRFGSIAREEHRGWHYSLAFEAGNQALDDYPLYMANGYATTQGILVVPRDDLIEGPTRLGGVADGGELNLDNLVNNLGYGVRLRTHPEFDNMPVNPTTEGWWQNQDNLSDNVRSEAYNAVYTWAPHVLRVADPATGDLTRWVVAVPCGKVWADPSWQIFVNNPTWAPSQYWLDKLGRGMVQFWEVQVSGNGYTILQGPTPEAPAVENTPLPRIFGPDENPGAAEDDQMAFRLASVELRESAEEEFKAILITVDFTGRLLISDVTGLLGGSPDQEWPNDIVWDPPDAFVDEMRNNVHSVAVDKVGDNEAYIYAAVRKVGIVVLRLTLDAQGVPQLDPNPVTRIQTTQDPWTIVLRENGPEKDLVVTDLGGGIRIYKDF